MAILNPIVFKTLPPHGSEFCLGHGIPKFARSVFVS